MYFRYWQSSANNQWYWHLRSANHEIIATGEGYTTEAGCLHVIGLVMDTNRQTPVYKA